MEGLLILLCNAAGTCAGATTIMRQTGEDVKDGHENLHFHFGGEMV